MREGDVLWSVLQLFAHVATFVMIFTTDYSLDAKSVVLSQLYVPVGDCVFALDEVDCYRRTASKCGRSPGEADRGRGHRFD